jgi:MFS family permease
VRGARGGLFASLGLPDFRRLWLVVAEAGCGQWAVQLAVGWLVQSLTHSTVWVGASLFALMIPNVVAAPWSGVLADRFDRSRLLAAATALAGGASLGLAALGLLGRASVWPILVLILLLGVGGTVLSTASTALLPNVVADKDLLNASALQAIAQRGSEFVGPAVAALVLAATGSWGVFALCVAFYGLGTWQSLAIRARPGGDLPRSRFLDGVRYVRANQPLGTLVTVVLAHCGLTMAYMGILPAFVQGGLSGGSGVFGTIMTAVGLGSILGALPLMTVRNLRVRGRLYLASAVGSGLAIALLGLTRAPAAAVAASLAVGACQSMFMTISFAEVQERSSDEFRGRVSAIYLLLAGGAMAIGNWVYGFLGASEAPAHILVAMGATFTVLFLAVAAGSDPLRAVCQLPPRRHGAAQVGLAEGG